MTATSATTRADTDRRTERLALTRVAETRTPEAEAARAERADIHPQSSEVNALTATANPKTAPLRCTPPMPGALSEGGRTPVNAPAAQYASSVPAPPAATASAMLSVRSCAVNRPYPAPSASRTANSRRRVKDRASRRFATFAHAIRSTSPTAASPMSSADFAPPASSSRSGTR